MNDLLHIYVCIVSPLLLMFFMLSGGSKRLNLFLILGMTACLAASYANQYLINLTGYGQIQATYYVTPMCEEILKALPILFYVLAVRPVSKNIITASIAVGIGFATLENCYYIMIDGAQDFFFLFLRGFATGVMHGMCTAIIGFGLIFIFSHTDLAFTSTFGLLCLSITYHATYNLLVASKGITEKIGVYMPIATAAFLLTAFYKPYQRFCNRHRPRHFRKRWYCPKHLAK